MCIRDSLLRKATKQKFLLFIPGEQPREKDNWLLDICLANHVFSTDESAVFLQELGLEIEFKPLISEHIGFFKNKERLASLQRILLPGEDFVRQIRYKMLAVVAKSEPTAGQILMSFIAEASEGKNGKFQLAEKFGLTDFLWKELERYYTYRSEEPSIQDLSLIHISEPTRPY